MSYLYSMYTYTAWLEVGRDSYNGGWSEFISYRNHFLSLSLCQFLAAKKPMKDGNATTLIGSSSASCSISCVRRSNRRFTIWDDKFSKKTLEKSELSTNLWTFAAVITTQNSRFGMHGMVHYFFTNMPKQIQSSERSVKAVTVHVLMIFWFLNVPKNIKKATALTPLVLFFNCSSHCLPKSGEIPEHVI